VLLPRQRSKLARGTKDKEHAMSQNSNTSIAVVGIDIARIHGLVSTIKDLLDTEQLSDWQHLVEKLDKSSR
jgi:hypothetical protein